ncbi:MAG: hypothetical protein ABI721_00845 [Candidatus Dojkabacteria bacterium]
MNPKLKFIDKILAQEKLIETRWYKNKIAPWNRINKGDVIYFKDSGQDVTARAEVLKVEQFDNLDKEKIKDLINKYFKEIGLNEEIKTAFINKHLNKNYAILIWLKNAEKIAPFRINKTGFGNAAAWLTLPEI